MKEKWNTFCDRYGRMIYPFVYFSAFFILDFLFRLIYVDASVANAFHWVPNLFTLCWSSIFALAAFLIPGKAKKIVMSVLLGIFVVLAFVHAVLYHVAGTFLSFSDLAFAEDGAAFISLQYLTFSPKVYLAILFALFLGVLAIFMAPKKESHCCVCFIVCVSLLALSVIGIIINHSVNHRTGTGNRFVWTDTYHPGSVYANYTEFTNPNECLMICGQYQYLFRSLTQSLGDYLNFGQMRKDLDAYYAEKEETPQSNEMTSALEGQNCIAILLESIDTWMITKEFMPNLWSLKENSVDFVNHYTPLFLSAGTFNTEFALNIGYYLPSTGTSASTYATNIYPNSLPNLFRNKGYTTHSYHTLAGRYYNREVVHPLWGYEDYVDYVEMGLVGDQTRDTTLMGGYDEMVNHDKPFFDYVITYSGHGPYNEVRSMISARHMEKAIELAQESGITTGNEDTWNQFVRALAHVQEVDQFIGSFVRAMKQDGTIHNTTLVLFTDHYSKYLTDTEFVMELKGATDMYSICHTPFFIYSEKLEPQKVEKITSSVDMLPTVANLFGLDYNARYLAGNDAFGDKGGFVCFKDYSWIDETMQWTPEYQGEMTEHVQKRNQEVRSLLNASWNTVKTNYFAYLQKKAQ